MPAYSAKGAEAISSSSVSRASPVHRGAGKFEHAVRQNHNVNKPTI
jgi:hypothetical protein